MKAEALPTVDGRRARRDRNRERVVDALLDLYREGELRPSVAEVADRSGVSHRSVFRYFEDLGELHRVAVERQFRAVRKYLLISGIGRGPLPGRIDKLIEGRLDLYDAAAPVARVAHMLAPVEPVLAEHLRAMASASLAQITQHFAAELESVDEEAAAATAEAATLVVSMESMEVLRHTRGLSRDRAAAAMRVTLHGLLSMAC
jgi:TetR/AcrR family transcriptional regulator, regulator of autoinduction and epiphytic fitness